MINKDYSQGVKMEPDTYLEAEADKFGMIHTRKSTSETEFLPGYGTTDFGVSPFEEKKIPTKKIFLASGLGAVGALAWNYKEEIKSGFQTVINYTLLRIEEYRDLP
jgi:hypothetical protein